MKNPFSILSFYFLSSFVHAQPNIQWQKALGGSKVEISTAIQPTSDGGYIVAGATLSNNNGDITGFHGGGDFWVVKLNNIGNIQWQKAMGGSSTEIAESIQQTNDGGYIVAGTTFSNDEDVSGNHGEADYWVLKLSATGAIQWQKTLGGSNKDEAKSIRQTIDGGYIVAGFSASIDGDVLSHLGFYDGWIVKLNESGDIQWQQSVGSGSGADAAYSIIQTNDEGYILIGETDSNEISGYHGGGDCWVAKLNKTGNIVWQKAFGGIGIDAAYSIAQTIDGGYIFVGVTASGNTGNITGSHGNFDYWVVKLSTTGIIQWQKALGGSDEDYGRSILQTNDGGYIVAGSTSSVDGDVLDNDGIRDFWVVKLNNLGGIIWQKTIGGSNAEWVESIRKTYDGGLIILGNTSSNDGDVSGYHGDQDFWVVKLSPESVATEEAHLNPLEIYPNPAHQSVSIQVPSAESTLSVSISDLLGREIRQQNISNGGSIELSSMANGLYLVLITTPSGKVFTGKLRKE